MPSKTPSIHRDEPLPDAETHSEGFRHAREARRGALVEDYIELIADLIDDGNEARQVDIAARLGVSQPTVAKMLARLCDDGLVSRRPYRGVFLTDSGNGMAQETLVRYQTGNRNNAPLRPRRERQDARSSQKSRDRGIGEVELMRWDCGPRGCLCVLLSKIDAGRSADITLTQSKAAASIAISRGSIF